MRALTWVCCVALSAPVWSQEPIFQYEIKLDAPAPARALLEKHLNVYKWQKQNRLTAELLLREVDAIPSAASDLLATEGYFDAKVRANYRTENDKNQVYIDVELGQQTFVGNTSVVLQGQIVDNPERYQQLTRRFERRGEVIEAQPFSQTAWDDFKKRALILVQARDYPAATLLDSEALIDPERKEAQFNLLIDSGPAYVFGPYTINGLSRYPASLIENRIKIKPGQPYSRSELNELQTEIQAMPHFSTALVDVALSNEAPYTAPVRIDVQEVQLHRLNGSLGYSTNTRLKSEIAYRYHDLFDQGWVFGGRLRLEQLEQAAEVGVSFPKGRDDWEHRGWASLLAQDLQGLDSHLYKLGVGRAKKSDDIERSFDLQYQIENRRFEDGSKEKPQTLTLTHSWIQRKLDNRRNPRNGYIVQAEVGGALEQILSDASFLRLYARGAYYYRLGRDGQLIAQANLGETFTNRPEGVTSDWLFRAGGSGSVRGYDYQSLGVKSNGSIVGGQVLGTASLELQYPLIKDWRAAVFADHGGAGASWATLEPVTGVGVGVRWSSPVGQIGADIAYGLDYQQYRFHFAMGLAF